MGEPSIRKRFLDEAARFVRAARAVPGVRRIALIGSIGTARTRAGGCAAVSGGGSGQRLTREWCHHVAVVRGSHRERSYPILC